jgi:hypothetical protein
MKKRLKDEGNESVTNCNTLKMTAADGKKRMRSVAASAQVAVSAGARRKTCRQRCFRWKYLENYGMIK